MMMKTIVTGALAFLCAGLLAANANDSSASLEIGGIELTQNDVISMDKEELFLSTEEVRVDYEYTNTSDEDVELLISFPLPVMPYRDGDYLGDRQEPQWADFDFETKVDGKPVDFDVRQIPTVNGEDVSALLEKHGYKANFWEYDSYAWDDKMQSLDFPLREAYEASGFLKRVEGRTYLQPGWVVETHVTRTQVFPAGQTVKVSHRYTPEIGQSMGGSFTEGTWDDYPEEGAAFQTKYCVDDSFKAALKKKQDTRGRWAGLYGETRLDYRLAPGANWKGPIKEFRLVIDKGSTENWISLCMDGIKKISPTQFEVKYTDFEPERDINIIFLKWYEMPEGDE